MYYSFKCLEICNMFLNTPWNIQHSFELCYSFQHTLKFSTCCFNIVFNTYYSFQHALKFSTCFSTHFEIFNIVLKVHYSFHHVLKFSTHFFNMCYSFQNMLKFSTCFFTVFRTCWKFQHAFLQFSAPFSICFQNVLQISTHSEIFNTLSNMKIWKLTVKLQLNPSKNICKILVRNSRTKNFKACWKPCQKFQSMSKITMMWLLRDPFHQFWNIITVIKIKSDIINEDYRSLWWYMLSLCVLAGKIGFVCWQLLHDLHSMENLFFNLAVKFLYFLSNLVNLLGIFSGIRKLRAFERNLYLWNRYLMPWRWII